MPDSDSTVPAGFRVIPGYPRYAIDENGTVLSICRPGLGAKINLPWSDAKRISLNTNRYGYSIANFGRTKKETVHKLVLLAFVGPCPDGMECRHLDGNPANNHVSNLAWGTRLENHHDKILHGTSGKGEEHSSSKLKAADVLEIRRRTANGERGVDLAKEFSVTKSQISFIVLRKRWKHI